MPTDVPTLLNCGGFAKLMGAFRIVKWKAVRIEPFPKAVASDMAGANSVESPIAVDPFNDEGVVIVIKHQWYKTVLLVIEFCINKLRTIDCRID